MADVAEAVAAVRAGKAVFCEKPLSLEKAEAMRPPGNDDALLRWNACARLIMCNKLSARPQDKIELQSE